MLKKSSAVLALMLLCMATGWADSITVENFSFELPGTGKINGWNGESGTDIPGWASDTAASDSGAASEWTGSTEGDYCGYIMAADSSIYNLTDYVIAAGEVFTLQVDARNNWSESGTSAILLKLYYDNTGTRVAVASATTTSMTDDWTTYSLTFKASDVAAAVGKKIGIELDNAASVNRSWLGVDNVRLDVAYVSPISPTDGKTKVSIDADLSWTVANGWAADLYFGTSEPNMVQELSQTTETTFELDPLEYLTTYYWRVDAYEPNSVSPYTPIKHTGPVWTFTTMPQSPEISTEPESITVAAGQDAVFTVEAVSTDTYKWYKEGVATALTTGDDYTVNGDTLTVLSVDINDEGYYYCVVSNNLVTDTDESLHVRLLTMRLIGWWKMDGDLNDAVAGNNASMADPNYAAGIDGQALDLDETEYAQVPGTETTFNFHPQGMTVSAWVKTTEANYGGIVSKADRTDGQTGWTLQHNGDTIYMVFRSVGGTDYNNGQAYVDASLTDGEWHLLAGMYDPDTHMVRMCASYVEEGISKLGYNQAGPYTVLTSTEDVPLVIGSEINVALDDIVNFKGQVDDVRLYTYAMSDTEVAEELFYPVTDEKVCVLSQFEDQAAFDFNNDCEVNLEDFATFAAQWLKDAFYPAD